MATIVEMINPLTGLPEQVDQLDHTAQEIDDAVDLAPQLSNPNLLDNWYFANPVNQRGQTSYTGAGYGIDRWLLKQGTMLIDDDHIVLKSGANNASAGQVIDNPNRFSGKVVTLSVLGRREKNDGYFAVRNNNTYFGISLHLGAELNVYSLTFTCKDNLTDFYIQYTSWTTDEISHVYAIKLELGTQQTLAHQDENGVWVLNEIPDYGEQLARCQRYFQLYSSADLRPAKAVDCRPVMRADPAQSTIVVNSTTYYYNTADL